uniref:Uncharacterized protein n=1 Tax=Plectus sambesii TaxID=2011161 RepID=A0A914VLG4_9BILA
MRHRRSISRIVVLLLCIFGFRMYWTYRHIPIELTHLLQLLANSTDQTICKLPKLDPWDPSILSYISIPDPLVCKKLQENVTYLADGVLHRNPGFEHLKCKYRTFGHNSGIDDKNVKYGDWVEFDQSSSLITSDLVEVECTQGILDSKSYRYHWSQVVKRDTSVITKQPFLPNDAQHLSVLAFGMDSMSRSNVLRQLPKTYKSLQKMGFIDLNGHVKVGDNTVINWIAILTGKIGASTREFASEWQEVWGVFYDNLNLTWYDYSREGYATYFAEDRPDIATFNYFNYVYGFKNQPTDHYFRPYWLASFWSLLKRRSSVNCYGSVPDHQLQLGFLENFVKKYEGTRSFAYNWLQDLGHDYLNRMGVADDDFQSFFERNENRFNNTIVIVFSDHGHRYAEIRETMIGRIEARMPFFSIRLPPWLAAKYPNLPARLKENSNKLTTQFDFHETLNDIAKGNIGGDDVIPSRNERAYSLFGAVPESRSCYEARVPEDYCPCYRELQLEASEATAPAKALLSYISTLLLTANGKCAALTLTQITYASVSLPPQKTLQDPQVQGKVAKGGYYINYRLVIKVEPSGALFEGVVIKNLDTDTYQATGEIERNNKYGNTSHCVADRILKKLCYCSDLL